MPLFKKTKPTSTGYGFSSASLPTGNNSSGEPSAAPDGHRSLRKQLLEVFTPRSKSKLPANISSECLSMENTMSSPNDPKIVTQMQGNQLEINHPTQSGVETGKASISQPDISSKKNTHTLSFQQEILITLGSSINDSQTRSSLKILKEVAAGGIIQALTIAKESADWNSFLKEALGGVVAVVNLVKQVSDNWTEMEAVLDHINTLLSIVYKLREDFVMQNEFKIIQRDAVT
ncbi:hypothetical protein C0995_009174 [Termitomyces sp. Mi166|nr:hypothetical protein C0995_009174 [Termitomyces sp. Mi166\